MKNKYFQFAVILGLTAALTLIGEEMILRRYASLSVDVIVFVIFTILLSIRIREFFKII
jgi:hypothetical protein